MLTVYQYDSYKGLIKDYIQAKREIDPDFSQAKLAERARVQKSYLSRVIAGDADLSPDQVYLCAGGLGLSSEERDYLMLLHEIDRCALADRRSELVKKRDLKRDEAMATKRALNSEAVRPTTETFSEYYSEPLVPIVHMFMTIPKFKAEPSLIGEVLGVTPARLATVLETLQRCGVLRLEKKGFQLEKTNLHLEPGSPLFKNFGTQFRLKAAQYLQDSTAESDYFFTASFSANEELRREIKRRFLEFLKWMAKEVSDQTPSHVYHMNFDLFKF